MGMYLRTTQRRNKDGSVVRYYALAENVRDPEKGYVQARVVHNFGRADRVDKAALERLVVSIHRVLGDDTAGGASVAASDIDIEAVFELGITHVVQGLWDQLGIGTTIRGHVTQKKLKAPHEAALLAMVAQRPDRPGSKLSCHERWLDRVWLPGARDLSLSQLYRALDILAEHGEAIEEAVFWRSADLFKLDVDLVFYDGTTAWFETDEEDEVGETWWGMSFDPLRKRGHSKEGRDNDPQVVIALAVKSGHHRNRRPGNRSNQPPDRCPARGAHSTRWPEITPPLSRQCRTQPGGLGFPVFSTFSVTACRMFKPSTADFLPFEPQSIIAFLSIDDDIISFLSIYWLRYPRFERTNAYAEIYAATIGSFTALSLDSRHLLAQKQRGKSVSERSTHQRREHMNGAKYIAKTLRGYGVDHVFFVEAILRDTLLEMHGLGIKRVLTHSEKTAAYMADGYARASGRVGICMAQSVGAANQASGLQEARLANSPVISITGKKPAMLQYRNSYQEIDHVPLFAPVTKYNVYVETARQLPHLLPQAFRQATCGRPGPVHLDMPDHQGGIIEAQDVHEDPVIETRFAGYPPYRPAPEEKDVEAAARALENADRPLLIVGAGAVVSGAHSEVRELAEKMSLPVVTSPDGKGIIPEAHPLTVGPVGRYSRECANRAVHRADLVFYIGCNTGDQVTEDTGHFQPARSNSFNWHRQSTRSRSGAAIRMPCSCCATRKPDYGLSTRPSMPAKRKRIGPVRSKALWSIGARRWSRCEPRVLRRSVPSACAERSQTFFRKTPL